MRREQTSVRVWTMPLLLAVASALGLVSALLADGAADVLAWLALAVPVLVVGCCCVPRAQSAFIRRQRAN
jgi:hypothetical protein